MAKVFESESYEVALQRVSREKMALAKAYGEVRLNFIVWRFIALGLAISLLLAIVCCSSITHAQASSQGGLPVTDSYGE